MEFSRQNKRIKELPLIPLIDVVFILIVFFMLTTSFMKVQSMELMLPGRSGVSKAVSNDIARVFLHNDGSVSFGERKVDQAGLEETLAAIFTKDPNIKVMLFPDSKVTVQEVVSMMDVVYLAGGRSLFVKNWNSGQEGAGISTEGGLAMPLPSLEESLR